MNIKRGAGCYLIIDENLQDLQDSLDVIGAKERRIGLKINVGKTKVAMVVSRENPVSFKGDEINPVCLCSLTFQISLNDE
jgi:hypothetical protein